MKGKTIIILIVAAVVFYGVVCFITFQTREAEIRKYATSPFNIQRGVAKDRYYYVLRELLDFPNLPYDNSDKSTMVGTPITINGYAEHGWIHLEVLTTQGDLLPVSIKGGEIDLKIFLHELKPSCGKYYWWKPVLRFPAESWFKDHYEISDVRILGRYLVFDNNRREYENYY